MVPVIADGGLGQARVVPLSWVTLNLAFSRKREQPGMAFDLWCLQSSDASRSEINGYG